MAVGLQGCFVASWFLLLAASWGGGHLGGAPLVLCAIVFAIRMVWVEAVLTAALEPSRNFLGSATKTPLSASQ